MTTPEREPEVIEATATPAGARRYAGSYSGLRYEAEACPECCSRQALEGAAWGGAIGWAASMLLGGGASARILGAAAGAAAGAALRRWHLRLEWDPDRARGERTPAARARA